jgi:gamma-glutamylcyclotransferase (GGCT)/AIG2-like uncharacterized protein YtfP
MLAPYFAYGSNMCREQMAKRCPGATPLGRAILMHHRFIITADGHASIVEERGARVVGVLWRITTAHARTLDGYEGVESGWYRRVALSVRYGSGQRVAFGYIGRTTEPGRSKPGYLDAIVLPAARDWKLPDPYVRELETWLRAGQGGFRAPGLKGA